MLSAISPTATMKLFHDWCMKSNNKFGDKFVALMQNGSVTLDELELFRSRSKRMCDVIDKLHTENKQAIAFEELYLTSKEDMLIPCSETDHGLVCMTPYQHLVSPTGCTKCSNKYQRTEKEFDKDLEAIFGNSIKRLDPYSNQSMQMRMTCIKHGEFRRKKSGRDLLCGKQGCPQCQIESSSEARKWKKDEWIERAQEVHGIGKDDYSNIELKIDENNILWIENIYCNQHDKPYRQRGTDHHRGHRCSLCKYATLSKKHRMPYFELIKRCQEIHSGKGYEYDENEPEYYKNGNSRIPVKCNTHGVWYPTAHNHMECESGCPGCSPTGFSNISIKWLELLSDKLGISIQHAQNGGEHIIIKNPDDGRGHYKLDGYHFHPTLLQAIVFEYHGCHVHGCTECYPNRDDKDAYKNRTHAENYQRTIKKKIFCEERFTYIEMWDCQWKNIINNPKQLEIYIRDLKVKLSTI